MSAEDGHADLERARRRKKLLDRQTKALDAVKEGGMGAVKGMFVVPARNTCAARLPRLPESGLCKVALCA